jgi:predicted  nucleic acid-binding Zn-ribbon protein
MACDERGHRALEQALAKMREERNEQTDRARRLHGNVVGLEAKVRDLEVALHDALERGAEAQVRAEKAEATIVEMQVVLAMAEA